MVEKTDPIALTLSTRHLGGIVCVDGRAEERIISAKADGTLKAGALVTVVTTIGATLGDIDGVEDAVQESVVGILLPKYNVDVDTAVTDGDPVEIVIPKAGRKYNVWIKDTGAAIAAGIGFVYSAEAGGGQLAESTPEAQLLAVCRCARGIANTSRYAEMIWGPN